MKRAIFGSLLALTLATASSLQAQTYTYDPVSQSFVLQSTTTSNYQPAQPSNIVQAAAQQFLPQYFGNSTTVQGSTGYYYPQSSGYYNNGYYNNGYNSSYYNGYNNGYVSPYGYSSYNSGYTTSPYSSYYNTGVNMYRSARGWRR